MRWPILSKYPRETRLAIGLIYGVCAVAIVIFILFLIGVLTGHIHTRTP